MVKAVINMSLVVVNATDSSGRIDVYQEACASYACVCVTMSDVTHCMIWSKWTWRLMSSQIQAHSQPAGQLSFPIAIAHSRNQLLLGALQGRRKSPDSQISMWHSRHVANFIPESSYIHLLPNVSRMY